MLRPAIAAILAAPKPTFSASLTNSLVPEVAVNGAPSFSRSTTATVIDQDGIIRYCLSGEARFSGARRVQNRITATNSEKVSTWNLGGGITSAVDNSSVLGSWNASKVTFSVGASSKYVYAISTLAPGMAVIVSYAVDITNVVTKICTVECCGQTAQFAWTSPTTITISGGATGFVTILGPYQAILYAYNSAATTGGNAVYFGAYGSYTSVSGEYAYVTRTMQENVTGQTNQNPAEYVSVGVLSAPYHGCGVDGVQYFPYLNGNTVSSGVVTAGIGAPIPSASLLGYLAEGQRTNLFLNSSVGVTQNITTTANQYSISFYGTGSITLTGTATGTLSGTGANNRVILTVTATAGTMVVSVSGSITNVNVEQASFASSYIPTTSASVTRNSDSLRYSGINLPEISNGSISASIIPEWTGTNDPTATQSAAFLQADNNNTGTLSYLSLWHYSGTNNGLTAERGTNTTRNNCDYSGYSIVTGSKLKMTMTWDTRFIKQYVNSILTRAVNAVNLPFTPIGIVATAIGIGCTNSGSQPAYSNINNVAIYNKVLPQTLIQSKSL